MALPAGRAAASVLHAGGGGMITIPIWVAVLVLLVVAGVSWIVGLVMENMWADERAIRHAAAAKKEARIVEPFLTKRRIEGQEKP
jgi:hypothetical protein